MASIIVKCYGSLQEKLEKEKENLKNVEANIKKIIGRTNVDSGRQVFIGQKRNSNFIEPHVTNSNAEVWKSAMEGSGFGRKSWGGRPADAPSFERADRRHRQSEDFYSRENREGPPPPSKRRSTNKVNQPKTVFSRLSGPAKEPDSDSTNYFPPSRKHAVSSHIVVTPVKVPSRSEALAVQGKDQNNKERNKRMFGALLGTLKRFKQDETKLKDREEKKALIEKKLEQQAIKEKQQLRNERETLFRERKMKYIEIRNIELKLARLKEQEEWEATQRPLVNFIRSKTAPHIFFLPKVMDSNTTKLLAESRVIITSMIEEKNKEVQMQVEDILRQGLEDQEMDEDQEIEDAYMQGDKHPDPQGQPMAAAAAETEEADLNTSGLDEFGRDISRREQPSAGAPVTSESKEKSRSPISKSRCKGKLSASESSPRRDKKRDKSRSPVAQSRSKGKLSANDSSPRRDRKRDKSRSSSPERRDRKKSKSKVKKIKQEDEERGKKRGEEIKKNGGKRAEEKENGGKRADEEDVKPKVTHSKTRDGSSSVSSSSDEESDYEDSDFYDENKVIKKEKVVVKKEKDTVDGEKKNNEHKEVSQEMNTPVVDSAPKVAENGNSSYPMPGPMDLNSISLPGE